MVAARRRAVVAAPPPVPRSFQGECPHCDKVTTHEEFFRQKRAAKSPQAAARGDFKMVEEYAFRCTTCGNRHEKILDAAGLLHKWQGNRHVAMNVG